MSEEKRRLQGLEMLNHLEKLSSPEKIKVEFNKYNHTWLRAFLTSYILSNPHSAHIARMKSVLKELNQ